MGEKCLSCISLLCVNNVEPLTEKINIDNDWLKFPYNDKWLALAQQKAKIAKC